MRMFSKAYDTSFPEIQKTTKTKPFLSPGIQIFKYPSSSPMYSNIKKKTKLVWKVFKEEDIC